MALQIVATVFLVIAFIFSINLIGRGLLGYDVSTKEVVLMGISWSGFIAAMWIF